MELWSWVLSATGAMGLYLAGRKVWWSWWVNLASQPLWAIYSIQTKQWGFLASTALYGTVFLRNAVYWTRENRKQALDEPALA